MSWFGKSAQWRHLARRYLNGRLLHQTRKSNFNHLRLRVKSVGNIAAYSGYVLTPSTNTRFDHTNPSIPSTIELKEESMYSWAHWWQSRHRTLRPICRRRWEYFVQKTYQMFSVLLIMYRKCPVVEGVEHSSPVDQNICLPESFADKLYLLRWF